MFYIATPSPLQGWRIHKNIEITVYLFTYIIGPLGTKAAVNLQAINTASGFEEKLNKCVEIKSPIASVPGVPAGPLWTHRRSLCLCGIVPLHYFSS